jgi:hypothetical protein
MAAAGAVGAASFVCSLAYFFCANFPVPAVALLVLAAAAVVRRLLLSRRRAAQAAPLAPAADPAEELPPTPAGPGPAGMLRSGFPYAWRQAAAEPARIEAERARPEEEWPGVQTRRFAALPGQFPFPDGAWGADAAAGFGAGAGLRHDGRGYLPVPQPGSSTLPGPVPAAALERGVRHAPPPPGVWHAPLPPGPTPARAGAGAPGPVVPPVAQPPVPVAQLVGFW